MGQAVMSNYPVILSDLKRSRCLVIGGGQVAARKVSGLVEAGAHPIVISPQLCSELAAQQAEITHIPRPYRSGDLDGAALVIVATDDHALNRMIADECRAQGILVNVVDCPELCTFTAPAVVRRGDLLVAIATSGRCPAFSRHLRELLETIIDTEYGQLLDILGELRPRIRQQVMPARQREVWCQLLDGRILERLRDEGRDAAESAARLVVERHVEPSLE